MTDISAHPATTQARRATRSATDSSESSAPRRRRTRSVGRSLWWFVVPSALVYLYVVIVPSLQGVYYSFTDWAFLNPPTWIGFQNYIDTFTGDAGAAAVRTLVIALVVVILQNVLGLGLALLLNGRVFGRNTLRTVIFAPMVVSALVVGYLFKYIFGPPGVGAINKLLEVTGLPQVDFLGNPTWALWIIVITIVWQFTGSTMVIYLAGLQGVAAELEEAAALDGAGYWKRFWYIVRPLLAPAITINLMLGLIGGLKIFDQIFSLTGGGPGNSTQTISTMIYQLFSQFGRYGSAAALAVVLAVAVGILSFIQFSVLRRQERKTS
ncbi:carbohydrate ABC transporter permease [Microbacterium sp. B2969]|uniref:Carbohydrate ABC transporter permease n=1 Tax=Microbacterium alkaliflavum TaxID=3248839 RepID=A0ABW7Q2G3_9MICO